MGCSPSKPKKVVSAENYLGQARTGDIVLFSSRGSDSDIIKVFTGSPYSHVGMVVRLNPIPSGMRGSGVYLWHSPKTGRRELVDVLNSPPKRKRGPQLNDLADVLNLYSEIPIDIRRIRIQPTSSHPWVSGSITPSDQLLEFMRTEHMKDYESSVMQLAKSSYDGPGGDNVEDTREYFCSELVAETFKQFNIMSTPQPSNEFYPGNFTSSGDYVLGVMSHVRFKHEVRIASAG